MPSTQDDRLPLTGLLVNCTSVPVISHFSSFLYLLYKHTSHTDKQPNSVLLLYSRRLLAFPNSLAVAFSAVVRFSCTRGCNLYFPVYLKRGEAAQTLSSALHRYAAISCIHIGGLGLFFSASRFSANERLIFIFMNVDLKEASSSKRCKNRI